MRLLKFTVVCRAAAHAISVVASSWFLRRLICLGASHGATEALSLLSISMLKRQISTLSDAQSAINYEGCALEGGCG